LQLFSIKLFDARNPHTAAALDMTPIAVYSSGMRITEAQPELREAFGRAASLQPPGRIAPLE